MSLLSFQILKNDHFASRSDQTSKIQLSTTIISKIYLFTRHNMSTHFNKLAVIDKISMIISISWPYVDPIYLATWLLHAKVKETITILYPITNNRYENSPPPTPKGGVFQWRQFDRYIKVFSWPTGQVTPSLYTFSTS